MGYRHATAHGPGLQRRVHAVSALLLETQDVVWFRDDLTGVRGAAGRLAEGIGLGEHRVGEVVLAVSEAVSNLVKHAVAGAIVLRIVRTAQHTGIEFLAADSGPGIADVSASMRDGRSSTGTSGIGLGAIARLADAFDLHSIVGQGTVMLARFWPRDERFVHPDGNYKLSELMVDRSPDEVVKEIHQGLAGTRGAAVAVARIEPDLARVLFCGVGDIAGAVVTSTSKTSLPTLPGIAGHQIRTPHTSSHSLPAGSAVVMHSDGLSGRWNPETLPGVLRHSPAVIAGHLLRSAGKYHDDASVVAAKGPW